MKGMFYFDLFLLGEFFIYNIFIVYMDLIYLLCLNDFLSVREVSSFFFRQNFVNMIGYEM